MKELPLVTVVIPARNEEADIADCLEALTCQDYPHTRMEVLVIDGESSDGTAALARKSLQAADFGRSDVLKNPLATTPTSLNVGLAHAAGEVVCRVDARSCVPREYIRTCAEILSDGSVAVAGGRQVAQPRRDATAEARGIARALRNPLVMGFARYRLPARPGPGDTVYLGAFRAADLRAVGGWDERYATNQDYELNRRLATRGKIWCDTRLFVTYRPRESLAKLGAQYRRFGRWKAAGWLEARMPLATRQVALVLLPPVVGLGVVHEARRNPRRTALGVLLALLVIDIAPGEPADLRTRLVGVLASLVVPVAWWLGVAEQTARYIWGDRLLVAEGRPTR